MLTLRTTQQNKALPLICKIFPRKIKQNSLKFFFFFRYNSFLVTHEEVQTEKKKKEPYPSI